MQRRRQLDPMRERGTWNTKQQRGVNRPWPFRLLRLLRVVLQYRRRKTDPGISLGSQEVRLGLALQQ